MSDKVYLIGLVAIVIFGFWGLIQLFLVFWLWCFYDRPIKKIHNQLIDIPKKINEESWGRGRTVSGIAPLTSSLERPLKTRLEKLKLSRSLFLDRIKLIFSVKTKL